MLSLQCIIFMPLNVVSIAGLGKYFLASLINFRSDPICREITKFTETVNSDVCHEF
jgi:hypothetical protein